MSCKVIGNTAITYVKFTSVHFDQKKLLDDALDTLSKTKRLRFNVDLTKTIDDAEKMSFSARLPSFIKEREERYVGEQTVFVSAQFYYDFQKAAIERFGKIYFGDTIRVIAYDKESGSSLVMGEFYKDKDTPDSEKVAFAENPQTEIKFKQSAYTIIID